MRAATCDGGKPEIGRPHDFALAHRNAAEICARYSPSPIRTISSSISPKRAVAAHALGVGGELAHRLDIGREPGEAMGGALLAVEQSGDRLALRPTTRSRTLAVASASSASTRRWRPRARAR